MKARFFDIRSGERERFLPAFGVLLLTIAGHTLLETARDALFLIKLAPDKLAYVYLTVALGSILVAPLNARISRAAGAKNALTLSLLATAAGAWTFWLNPLGTRSVFALYVFGTLSATLLVGQFWMFAGQLFSAGENRRLFGPLASGGVLGAVLGAAIAAILVRHPPVRSLLAAATICYASAAILTGAQRAPETPPLRAAGENPTSALTRVRRDPFVLRLALGAALSAFIGVLIDYVYKSKVASSIAPSSMGNFFARYQLVLNLASLVMQVGMTSVLVERLGVVTLTLLPPVLLILTSVAAAVFSGSFLPFVVLKGTDSALRNSLTRVGNELLWAPVEDQARARNWVDLIVPRGAQATAALLLLGMGLTSPGAPRLLALAACGLAFLWVANGVRLRVPYIELFRRAIGRGGLGRDALHELDLTAVEALVEALAQPAASRVLAAMNLLFERGRSRLIPALILYHRDETVLIRALEIFATDSRKDWIPLGEELLDHPSSRVRTAAVRAHALSSNVAALERAMRHDDPVMRAFGAIYLAQHEERTLDGDPLDWPLFTNDDEEHRLKKAFIEAIGKHPIPNASGLLLKFARLPALHGPVTEALSTTAEENATSYLIGRLAFIDCRPAARRGLVRIGGPALDEILRVASDPALDRRVSVHIPRTLAAFKNARALNALVAILRESNDGLLRYKALRGVEHIAVRTLLPVSGAVINEELERNSKEHLRLWVLSLAIRSETASTHAHSVRLVLELLEDKLRQSKDRLCRLLQVAHRSDDMRAIFAALGAKNSHERSRALEFLDASIRKFGRASDELAVLFRLVVDDMPDELRRERAAAWVGRFPTAASALAHLAAEPQPAMRVLAAEAQTLVLSQDAASVPDAVPHAEKVLV